MRRKDRERGRDFAYEVIDGSDYGVVAFAAAEGPYCIPLSLVRLGDELFFHCAFEGRKLDLLRHDPQVCATFVSQARPCYIESENEYTTTFRSAVVTGTAFEVTDPGRKTDALRALCQKLTPEHMAGFDAAAAHSLDRTAIWGIRITEAVGKEKA